jgi:hypothetical protein
MQSWRAIFIASGSKIPRLMIAGIIPFGKTRKVEKATFTFFFMADPL